MTSPQKAKPNAGKGKGKGPGRPCNAFLIFRAERDAMYPPLLIGKKSAVISREWNALSEERKAGYFQRAEDEKTAFKEKYPDHKYCPRTQEEIKAGGSEALRIKEKKAAKAKAREMKDRQRAPKRTRKSNNVSSSTATQSLDNFHLPDVSRAEPSQALLPNEAGDVSGLPHPTKTSATSVQSAHESQQPPVYHPNPPAQYVQSVSYSHAYGATPPSFMVPEPAHHYNDTGADVPAYQPNVLPHISQHTVPVDAYGRLLDFHAGVGPTNSLKRAFDQIEQDDVEVTTPPASDSCVAFNVHGGYSDGEWPEFLAQTKTDAEASSAPNPAAPTANEFEFGVGMGAQFSFNANGSTYFSDQYGFSQNFAEEQPKGYVNGVAA